MFRFDASNTPRRSFLGRLTGGAAALLAGSTGIAAAAETAGALVAPSDEFLTKLHGQYRQFFDAVEFAEGFPVYYAFNWAKTMKETYKVPNSEVTAVIGLRHKSIAPAFNDTIWSKYKLGQFFKIDDPKTKAPSVRNFLNNEADVLFPGSSVSKQVADGAVVTVCNLATTIFSGMVADAAGLKMKHEDAYKEWAANMLPGAYLVPSGVLAVHRAQKAGNCSYCFAAA
jgi:hypothetical protein